MIDLVARDDRSGYGIACALDIERIPYRRIARADEFDARLLVVATDEVTPDVTALAARVPTVLFGAPAVGAALFGAAPRAVAAAPVTLPLADPAWPASVRATGATFGTRELRLPSAPALIARPAPGSRVRASWMGEDGVRHPAVVTAGRASWCLVDLGAAFADLLDERWFSAAHVSGRILPRWFLAAYYRAPERLRARLQRRVYARLRARTAGVKTSTYPVDATGWLCLELLKALLDDAAGGLVRLARWPAPFTSAAVLTHDLEPSRYAYTRGLGRLLDRVARAAVPATFGVVARAAGRHLSPGLARRVAAHDVLCHGLEHRGETLAGGLPGLTRARDDVAAAVGVRPEGFRSPRLDRSPALLRALDGSGFRYDSSYPDVDRESDATFGGGVRLNVPFRPPIADGERVRPSGCLELPVSAPDCIQPLFGGEGVRALAGAVRAKTSFTRATGGLYVGIVHAGVFGGRDAARRAAHLGFVRRRVRHPDTWLATARQVAEWWCAREAVAVAVDGETVQVTNHGARAVADLDVVVGTGAAETRLPIPALAPGASATIPLVPAARVAVEGPGR